MLEDSVPLQNGEYCRVREGWRVESKGQFEAAMEEAEEVLESRV